jgi:hypothetical protein
MDEPLFPTRTGRRLSDDAVEARLAIYKPVAVRGCPSLVLSATQDEDGWGHLRR